MSAPSIPGLLSLDPIGDPTSLLSSLTMGTEVEVQFGKSLQVATLQPDARGLLRTHTNGVGCYYATQQQWCNVLLPLPNTACFGQTF